MSKYPEDEFDRIEELGLPAGVHRSPRSAWSKVAPFVVVVVLCAALAVAAVYLVARTPGSPLSEASQTAGEPAAEDPADGEVLPEDPAVDGEATPEGEAPADGEEAPEGEAPAEEEPAAPPVVAPRRDGVGRPSVMVRTRSCRWRLTPRPTPGGRACPTRPPGRRPTA